jgi:hypothetical protein
LLLLLLLLLLMRLHEVPLHQCIEWWHCALHHDWRQLWARMLA